MKKNGLMIIVLLLTTISTIACNKNNVDSSESLLLEKQQFEKDVIDVTETVRNIDYNENSITRNYFMTYFIENGLLFSNTYNSINGNMEMNFSKDVSDYRIKSGKIIQFEDGDSYVSIENDKYCAVKDFGDENINIYDISEKSKCHIFYVIGKEINLSIVGESLENNEIYNFGSISDTIIELKPVSNILDDYNCSYSWYRNGELIEGANGRSYVIIDDYEDADYYVKVTTPKGKTKTSDSVNVKIDRR